MDFALPDIHTYIALTFHLILLLRRDEPTTGLGTNAAALVMNAVRQATDAMGLITVATIHQPSVTIFNAFHDVLLLTKGGELMAKRTVCWKMFYV